MDEATCEWIKVEDMWETECNLLWFMSNDDSLIENNMNYCPKCGKKIREELLISGMSEEGQREE